MSHPKHSFVFEKLIWDSDYFGISSAKVVLHTLLTLDEWKNIKEKISKYQFVSIVNKNSNPHNSQLIGKDTTAFIADINIQFIKKINKSVRLPKNISVYQGLERNNEILEIANFKYSKFIEDPELAKRGGKDIYLKWLENSFGNVKKHYAISKDAMGKINGFLLYSYVDEICLIELIAVSSESASSGIGSSLFQAVEHEAFKRKCFVIKVGTQLRNTGAINFYNKVGCRQTNCHQVYHIWNQ